MFRYYSVVHPGFWHKLYCYQHMREICGSKDEWLSDTGYCLDRYSLER